jgi:hypothetical protein
MENDHFSWENPLFLWSFSIANYVKLPEGKSHGLSLMCCFAYQQHPTTRGMGGILCIFVLHLGKL